MGSRATTSGRAGSRRAARRRRRLKPVLLVVAGAVVLGGGGSVALLHRPLAGAATNCEGALPVRLAAAPEIAPVLRQAASALEARDAAVDGTCVDYQVVAREPGQVLSRLSPASKHAAQLWVPDFSMWLEQATLQGAKATVVAGSLAKSPVVAVSRGGATPASWTAVGRSKVAYLDPLHSSASAIALLSAFSEMKLTGASQEQLGSMMVPLAQRYGAEPDKPTTTAEVAAAAAAGDYGVMSEQQLVALQQHGSARGLRATVPATGTMVLGYPLAALTSDTAVVKAGSKLARYLAGHRGRRLLASHGFRDTADSPLATGAGLGPRDFGVLQTPDAGTAKDAMDKWAALAKPARSIAVIDVSGSMDFTDGDGRSRISETVDAATHALTLYPDNAQIGLWAFSQRLGGPHRDYVSLADVAPLGATSGGRTHREQLAAELAKLPQMTGGGTGLYDSTLAAVRALRAGYDPRAVNRVIVLTDGRNDDAGSISLQQLGDTLRREADPARPVSVIAIGMGPDADAGALAKVAEVTGGHSYLARDPSDIAQVFFNAMLSR